MTYPRANIPKMKAIARRARGHGIRTKDVEAFRRELIRAVAEIVLTDKRFRKYRDAAPTDPIATALFANIKDIKRIVVDRRCCEQMITNIPYGILSAQKLHKFPEGKHIVEMCQTFDLTQWVVIWVAFPMENGRVCTGEKAIHIPTKKYGVDCHSMGCDRTNAKHEMRTCAVCQQTTYCSLDCQVNHWELHQEHCGPPPLDDDESEKKK